MQRENERKHLTKEQLRALLFRKDGAATKHIPESVADGAPAVSEERGGYRWK